VARRDGNESQAEVLKKAALLALNAVLCVVSVIWGLTYQLMDGHLVSSLLCWSFSAASFLCLILLTVTKSAAAASYIFILAILLVPGGLHASMEGFHGSSGVILWSGFAPVASLVLLRNPLGALLMALLCTAVQATLFGLYDLGSGISPLAPSLTACAAPRHSGSVLVSMNAIVPGLGLGLFTGYFIQRSRREEARVTVLLEASMPTDVIALCDKLAPPFGFRYPFLVCAFVDVVGFTQWTSEVLPEVLLATLNSYFEDVRSIVAGHPEVEVVKLIGDAVMLVSGRPRHDGSGGSAKAAGGPGPDRRKMEKSGSRASSSRGGSYVVPFGGESAGEVGDENDSTAQRVDVEVLTRVAAVDTMLECLQKIIALTRTTPFGPESKLFQVRAGVDAGDCVGGVLTTGSMDYFGDVVNVAARLESIGKPGAIHASRNIVTYANQRFAFSPLASTELKGHNPIDAAFLKN
jgi:class 3 adenylate cyclase